MILRPADAQPCATAQQPREKCLKSYQLSVLSQQVSLASSYQKMAKRENHFETT